MGIKNLASIGFNKKAEQLLKNEKLKKEWKRFDSISKKRD